MGVNGMATETSDGKYTASKNTEALDKPGIRAGVGFGYVDTGLFPQVLNCAETFQV
jgi:hypothetical protein